MGNDTSLDFPPFLFNLDGFPQFLQSQGETFYVGARREEGAPNFLYKWDSDSDQELPVHQYSDPGTGDCLTVSSSDGSLVARGFDCSLKKKPLCLRLDNAASKFCQVFMVALMLFLKISKNM